jgi:uncharacterized protein with NRDE domain
MCLVALFFRAVPDAPLVVGANREEWYDRPGEPPQILDGPCRAVAGVDPRAGGTWLGVNDRGVLVAVTNRPKLQQPPRPRSRGLLVRDLLLNCPRAADAVEAAKRELDSGNYAGCNLVAADRERAVVLHAGDWLSVWPLPPGLHVLTNHDVNQEGDVRVAHALAWLGRRPYAKAADCLDALKDLCGQRGGEGPPICLYGEGRGTVSSTLVALRPALAESVYLHAQGPPDRTPYEDCSHLLRELAGVQPAGG